VKPLGNSRLQRCSSSPKASAKLTGADHSRKLSFMQLTIDIPEELAQKAQSEPDRLRQLIQEILQREAAAGKSPMGEVFGFLARNPSAQEILQFRPSQPTVERMAALLEKNRQDALTSEEEAELDTMQSLNHLFGFLKVQARQQVPPGL
jgi:hypothetical protein